MKRRPTTLAACIAAAAALAGCDPMAAQPSDAGTPAPTTQEDARAPATEYTIEGFRSAPPIEPLAIGPLVDDAGTPQCGPCTVEPGCIVPIGCDEGACVFGPAADGTPCPIGQCLMGSCTLPTEGCGNGILETAEGCDDGNTAGGDACSTACMPTTEVREGRATFAGIARDGTGNLLAIWLREEALGAKLLGQRMGFGGAPLGPELELAAGLSLAYPANPSIAGLGSGWIVTWAQPETRLGALTIQSRRVTTAGALSPAARVDTAMLGTARAPRVAPLSTGHVIAWWEEQGEGTDVRRDLRYRLFPATAGNPVRALAQDGSGDESDVSIASSGDSWVAVWVRQTGATSSVFARRFNGAGPSSGDVLIATGASAPAVTFLAGGSTAIGFRKIADRHSNSLDIQVVTWPAADATPGTPTTLTAATSAAEENVESAPSIAAIGEEWAAAYSYTGPRNSRGAVVVGSAAAGTATLLSESLPVSTRGVEDVSLASTGNVLWTLWTQRASLPNQAWTSAFMFRGSWLL